MNTQRITSIASTALLCAVLLTIIFEKKESIVSKTADLGIKCNTCEKSNVEIKRYLTPSSDFLTIDGSSALALASDINEPYVIPDNDIPSLISSSNDENILTKRAKKEIEKYRFIKVEKGDTLSGIAQKHKLSINYIELYRINKGVIKSIDMIFPNQILRIPNNEKEVQRLSRQEGG